MALRKSLRGYIRPLPRLTEAGQRAKLTASGCGSIYVEAPQETLADLIASLRKGDTVCVVHLHVLAAPRRTTKDKPRDALWDAVIAIEAKGASILEVETGRATSNKSDRDGMIRDAIEHLTSAGRAAAGRRNGKKSKGRPPAEFTSEEIAFALAQWYDVRHETNADALKAIRAKVPRWTMTRCYNVKMGFGPSGRGS